LEEKFQETTDTTILCIVRRLEALRWFRTRIEMGTNVTGKAEAAVHQRLQA
jgi:hypothetical protein